MVHGDRWLTIGSMRTQALLWALVAIPAIVAAFPAQAQQILVPSEEHDRVRVSGFFWRAKTSGVVDFLALDEVPGFEEGLDLAETLGFTEPDTGWILEGNFAAGRRHRFIVELARLENSAEHTATVGDIGPFRDLVVNIRSDIGLREAHGYYNFLFVARPEVEFGLLTGVGWFEAAAAASADIGRVGITINQAFPTFGGNLLIYPKGPVRGYIELTGFPRVNVDILTGWQLDLVARAEIFVIRNVGFVVGYRRYRLGFEIEGEGIALDVVWDGFTFGAQARF